jgi:hypothetical protein
MKLNLGISMEHNKCLNFNGFFSEFNSIIDEGVEYARVGLKVQQKIVAGNIF